MGNGLQLLDPFCIASLRTVDDTPHRTVSCKALHGRFACAVSAGSRRFW